ncbi:methyltransferase [Chloroflexi bacterium TSY]|nr:methyltransferase [Chloroflexi bacterium TSY]
MPELIFTTNPGLEDVVIDECRLRFQANQLSECTFERQPHGLGGYIQLHTAEPMDKVWPVVKQMRSIHHIHQPLHYFSLSPESTMKQLDQIREVIGQLDVPGLTKADTFRVSSKRSGQHEFTSVDVQKTAGAALVNRYGKKVNLKYPEINVRVDVFRQNCYVALQLTNKPLDFRYDYVFRPRIAIKTNLAFSLLHLAGLQPTNVSQSETACCPWQTNGSHTGGFKGPRLLEPFCGSGTILLEAATCLPSYILYGSDRYEKPVEWTQGNLSAAGFADRLILKQADARDISEIHAANSIRAIVTNPPFGKVLGANVNFTSLFRDFLHGAETILEPGGRIAMLVWKRNAVNKALRGLNLNIVHVRIVDTGGLFPGIFVLQKKDS